MYKCASSGKRPLAIVLFLIVIPLIVVPAWIAPSAESGFALAEGAAVKDSLIVFVRIGDGF
jgi:hypothetical protein